MKAIWSTMSFYAKTIHYRLISFCLFATFFAWTSLCVADIEKDNARCYELDRWLSEGRYGHGKWRLDKDWLRLYQNALFAEIGTMFKSPELKFLHNCEWFGRAKNEQPNQRKKREILATLISDIQQGRTDAFEIYYQNNKLEYIALKTLAALKSRNLEILSELFSKATYSTSLSKDWISEDGNAQLTDFMILNMTDNFPMVHFQTFGCCGEEDGPVETVPLKDRLFEELFAWENKFKYLTFAPIHSMCEARPPTEIMFSIVSSAYVNGGIGYNWGCDSKWYETRYYCDKDIPLYSLAYQVRFILGDDEEEGNIPVINEISRVGGYCP